MKHEQQELQNSYFKRQNWQGKLTGLTLTSWPLQQALLPSTNSQLTLIVSLVPRLLVGDQLMVLLLVRDILYC